MSCRLLRAGSNPHADTLLCFLSLHGSHCWIGVERVCSLQGKGDRAPLSPVKTMNNKVTSLQKASLCFCASVAILQATQRQ